MEKIVLPIIISLFVLLMANQSFGKVYSDSDLQNYDSGSGQVIHSTGQSASDVVGCAVLNYMRDDEKQTVSSPGVIHTFSTGDSDTRFTTGTISGGGTRQVVTETCIRMMVQNTDSVVHYYRPSDIQLTTVKGNTVSPIEHHSSYTGPAKSIQPGETKMVSACFVPLSAIVDIRVDCE